MFDPNIGKKNTASFKVSESTFFCPSEKRKYFDDTWSYNKPPTVRHQFIILLPSCWPEYRSVIDVFKGKLKSLISNWLSVIKMIYSYFITLLMWFYSLYFCLNIFIKTNKHWALNFILFIFFFFTPFVCLVLTLIRIFEIVLLYFFIFPSHHDINCISLVFQTGITFVNCTYMYLCMHFLFFPIFLFVLTLLD